MKFLNKSFLGLALLSALAFGCSEEEDVQVYNGPALASFKSATETYFVPESNESFEITIGLTAPATETVTYQVSVDEEESSAVAGEDYTLGAESVTFQPGELVKTIEVTGNFETVAEPKNVVLKLQDVNANADFYQVYDLTLTQYCPLVQEEMVGTYALYSEFFGAAWYVEVVAGSDPNTVIVKEPYADGLDLTISLNDSNPANFLARAVKQHVWNSATYGAASVEGTGPFTTCEKTISLSLTWTVSAGSFGTYTDVLVKQ